jgi:Tfp pilus assembly protein PilN
MSTAQPLSFLPESYLVNKSRRRANLICAALFLIVVGGIGSAYVLTNRSLHNIEREHDQVQRQYADAANRIEQVKQLQQKEQVISRQAELASSLLEKVPRSNLLAEITNALPPGASLVDLSMTSTVRPAPPPPAALPGASVTAPKEIEPQPKLYDVSINLTGVAADDVQVAQFIRNLSGSKMLRDVNLVVVDQDKIGDDTVRKFQLNMMINPTADLQQEGAR